MFIKFLEWTDTLLAAKQVLYLHATLLLVHCELLWDGCHTRNTSDLPLPSSHNL